MNFYDKQIPCFGVAGNFTGHLEQAGEAIDFKYIKTLEQNAPKAIFPTFLPENSSNSGSDARAIPEFLKVFPFDQNKILFPKGEEKVQIEPECAIICKATWKGDQLAALTPYCFGASNDCSIRKQGAKKISEKKNWGPSSKGLSENLIVLDSFTESGLINEYRIASFLIRDGKCYDYGENSPVRGYSYIYEKLLNWLLEKFNNQKDDGPAEDIHSYLLEAGRPSHIMISIGATRYTTWGETNFLQNGDKTVIMVYPESKYTPEQIKKIAAMGDFSDKSISALVQTVEV